MVFLLVGCMTHEPATITVKHLVGSYRINDVELGRTVFNSPTTAPQCCLGVYRRTDSTLELAIGASPTSVRIYITDVPAAAPQKLELGPANTTAYFRGASIEVSGQLDLGIFHCADEPDTLGCALTAKGAWVLSSADGNLSTNGWFEAADTVGPLTF